MVTQHPLDPGEAAGQLYRGFNQLIHHIRTRALLMYRLDTTCIAPATPVPKHAAPRPHLSHRAIRMLVKSFTKPLRIDITSACQA